MPTQSKAAVVAEIKEKLTASSGVILSDYRGLTVKEMQALRARLRAAGAEIKIYKNSLTELALRELSMPEMDELLTGPTAFTFAVDDPVSPAKAMLDFSKDHKALEIKGGLIEHSIVDAASVKALAALPSRDVLVARLLSVLQGPISGFVRSLNGPAAALTRALDAVARQKAAA